MTKIVITNHGSRMNKGNAALLNSRIKTLKKYIPDAEFVVFTYHPEIDYKPEMKYMQGVNIRFYEVPCKVLLSPRGMPKTIVSTLKLLFCSTKFIKRLNVKGIREYEDADVIISTGGDVLTEDYGSISFFNYVINLLLGILLNKPVVLYAESIGPFKLCWNRIVAKFLLSRVKLITLREEISQNYLEVLGKNRTTTYLTADSAFLLEPAPPRRIKEIMLKEEINKDNTPVIGISVSKIISRYGFLHLKTPRDRYRQYVLLMSKVVDYLIDKLDATVVFIPHVIEPWGNDDRTVANDIISLVKHEDKCISIREEYTVEELKGIIGECDMFMGARMHATIASASMFVPTIAIAYSHKTHGVIGKMLGQKDYILDIGSLDYNVLLSKINEVWSKREKVKTYLQSKMGSIKDLAALNAKFVKDLVLKS